MVAALAALATAVLNYRSRPILIRTIEKHSEDLKEMVERWLGQIPQPPEARSLREGLPPEYEYKPLRLAIEDEFLFSDLKEHMSPGENVLGLWEGFKCAFDDYIRKRFDLFNEIKKDAETNTGLKCDGFDHSISRDLVHGIYADVFRVLEGYAPDFLRGFKPDVQAMQGMFELWCYYTSFARGTEEEMSKTKSFVQDALQKLKDSPHLSKAKKILEERDRLMERRRNLFREIKDFLAIPILPSRCKYIKRSINL